jgi:hypothetical protein
MRYIDAIAGIFVFNPIIYNKSRTSLLRSINGKPTTILVVHKMVMVLLIRFFLLLGYSNNIWRHKCDKVVIVGEKNSANL